MNDGIVYLGPTDQRTSTNRNGHVVNVSRNALRAGVNLVATDLLCVLWVFASIIEDVMDDGDRVICFHDDAKLHGISSRYNILNIGGTITGATIRESDGEHVARYARAYPKQHIFINLSALKSGSPARFIAAFANAYRDGAADDGAFELVAHYGIHRSITRTRDGIGDTRAAHDAMRFQHLASIHNIGILNAANSLSELPKEFVTNTPNLAFGRIMLPKHYNELGSHVPDDDMRRIRINKHDDGYGVMKVANGPLTYYPGTDVPNDLGRDAPFILLPRTLKSDIGQDPKDRRKPKRNGHLDDYTAFIERSREERAAKEETLRIQQIADKAVQSVKDKAIRAGAIARATTADGAGALRKPMRTVRRIRTTANDNASARPQQDVGETAAVVAMMLQAAAVPHADVLSRYALATVNARGGQFNAPLDPGLTAQKLALHVIGDTLVQEAILAGHAIAEREGSTLIGAASLAAAYLEALDCDRGLARRFFEDEIVDTEGRTIRRLRQIGVEASEARRNEAQFHLVRGSWGMWRSASSVMPSAA